MKESLEKLLQPVSEQEPCGPDLSYDSAFDELQTLLKGKPEVEMGEVKKPAEPPDWAQLRTKSAAFLERSKHLEVAIFLCCSLMRTEGFAGFVDGLQFIRGLLEQYWEKVYPLLDPEDNNDPTLRLNRLGALTTPRGAAAVGGSWLRFVDYVYETPLCRPQGMPPITFAQVHASAEAAPSGE
jgi:type VI secretion system protein ImpA